MSTITKQPEIQDQDFKSKYEASIKAGYTHKEIVDSLAKNPTYSEKIQKSRQAGYSDDQIGSFLSTYDKPNENNNTLTKPKNEESSLQSFNRYLGQGLSALVTLKTWPGAVTTALGTADAIKEFGELQERLPRLKKLFPTAPWGDLKELDKNKYMEAVELAEKTGPTPENVIKTIEDITSLPLTAKTKGQRFVKYLAEAATLSSGGAASKTHKALKAGAYSSYLQESGVPEGISELTGLLMSHYEFPSLKEMTPKSKASQTTQTTEPEVPPTQPPTDNGLPPTPTNTTTPQSPQFKAVVPEHEILERITPVLDEELSRRVSSIGRAPEVPPRFALPKPVEPEPINTNVLKRDVGQSISNVRIPNTTAASLALRNEINTVAQREYANVRDLYRNSRELNQNVEMIHPEMSSALDELIADISQAEVPSTVQRDIIRIANRYRNLAGDQSTGLRPIRNSQLIAQIESNNQKINHDYLQGRPSNQYIRLNQILGEAIDRTAQIAPEAVAAHDAARAAYRDWSHTFGSSEILPWRDPSNLSHAKLLKSIENVDQIALLENLMERSPRGQRLIESIKRDFIEKKFKPFIEDPRKIDSIDFDEAIREITPITTPQQRDAITRHIENAGIPRQRYERQLNVYNESKTAHTEQVNRAKGDLKNWSSRVSKINSAWPYKTDTAILRDMTSVRGLKRLESNIPKTDQGKKLLDEIKDYASSNLLTQGKIVPSDKSESLRKILNDVNQRALLEHTLGKSITGDLVKIVNNVPKIDAKMAKLQQGIRLGKNIGKLIPGVSGKISAAEALLDTWKMFRPAATGATYETVDMGLIQKIIENRKDLTL